MGRIWRRKWLLIGITAAVFLSLGTVAWAVSVDEVGTASADPVETPASAAMAAGGRAEVPQAFRDACGELRDDLQDRRAELRKTRARLMEELRDEMTEADKAVYDGLKASIEEQQQIMKEARGELREALESLRELAKKYLDVETGSGT